MYTTSALSVHTLAIRTVREPFAANQMPSVFRQSQRDSQFTLKSDHDHDPCAPPNPLRLEKTRMDKRGRFKPSTREAAECLPSPLEQHLSNI
ncbi:hypothetical protein AVEN_265862-1 [Araneus ventricosus]|uniref:Uncharacterized protein n=1 Tax=Araneus ventricosus TaxID=182803 RepID=A0A4Y2C6S2_ARAVE|nr:hypothetical protein AVEN_192829-1 [Araneus ventricosus]GBM00171.1 hypothetical protein AVEN_265862-1 [Araneus ventricosus]